MSEVRKEGNHKAASTHETIKLMGEISSIHKIFVRITFGKLDNILQYFFTYNILLYFTYCKNIFQR
jgi:hypothetical protein